MDPRHAVSFLLGASPRARSLPALFAVALAITLVGFAQPGDAQNDTRVAAAPTSGTRFTEEDAAGDGGGSVSIDAIDAIDEPTGPPPTPRPRLTPPPSAEYGEQVCVTANVTGAVGRLCAQRYRFGARLTTMLTDKEADGQGVTARVSLDVTGAPDPTQTYVNRRGKGEEVVKVYLALPKTGTAIRTITITTCVVMSLRPDRCRTNSATLPQLASHGTPEQQARLRSLVFEQSLDSFMSAKRQDDRSGVDLDFDWEDNGCSVGPFAGYFDERINEACLRHDFAYRNLGNLFYAPTDAVRRRVDEQLAEDALELGHPNLAGGLVNVLHTFGGPAFFGKGIVVTWLGPGSRILASSEPEGGTASEPASSAPPPTPEPSSEPTP